MVHDNDEDSNVVAFPNSGAPLIWTEEELDADGADAIRRLGRLYFEDAMSDPGIPCPEIALAVLEAAVEFARERAFIAKASRILGDPQTPSNDPEAA